MTLIQALVLAAVQGLTEFLPISSSAHLVLVPNLLGWTSLLANNELQVSFDIALHFGSLLALIIYFRGDLWNIILSLKRGKSKKLLILIIIASIPAFLSGFLLENFFESLFAKPLTVSVLLLVTGLILFAAEKGERDANISADDLNWRQAFAIGIAQAIAIAPGISRSGATIATGVFQGMKRYQAARFSFLLAIPAIAGATVLSLVKGSFLFNTVWVAGFLSSTLVSYLAIKFLINYLKSKSLLIFAYYCWFAGILFIILSKAGIV